MRVEKVRNRFQVGKHFQIAITDTQLRYTRDTQHRCQTRHSMGSLLVPHENMPGNPLPRPYQIGAYKSLAAVGLSGLKTVDLYVRPIGHRSTERVRARICMLAYYVEWYMHDADPTPVRGDDKAAGEASGPP